MSARQTKGLLQHKTFPEHLLEPAKQTITQALLTRPSPCAPHASLECSRDLERLTLNRGRGMRSEVGLVAVHDVLEAVAVVEDALEQTAQRVVTVHELGVLRSLAPRSEQVAAVVEQVFDGREHARREDGGLEGGERVVLQTQLQHVACQTTSRSASNKTMRKRMFARADALTRRSPAAQCRSDTGSSCAWPASP